MFIKRHACRVNTPVVRAIIIFPEVKEETCSAPRISSKTSERQTGVLIYSLCIFPSYSWFVYAKPQARQSSITCWCKAFPHLWLTSRCFFPNLDLNFSATADLLSLRLPDPDTLPYHLVIQGVPTWLADNIVLLPELWPELAGYRLFPHYSVFRLLQY